MCRTLNPWQAKRQKDKKDSRSPRRVARAGATSIPTGFGLRLSFLSFCRFCLERFQRPTVVSHTLLARHARSVAGIAAEGQPQSKTIRGSWCYNHSDRFWTAAVLLVLLPLLSRTL